MPMTFGVLHPVVFLPSDAMEWSEERRAMVVRHEIAHIERIMREGTGADRQLAVWERTQDMKAVVDQIIAETNESLAL